jgi:hypothetical protein
MRLLTDNGSVFRSKLFRQAGGELPRRAAPGSRARAYCSAFSTARLIACTPVLIDGSGTGAK